MVLDGWGVEVVLNIYIFFSVYSLRLCGVAKQNKNDLDVVVVLVELGVARMEKKSIHWTCLEDNNKTAQT